MPGRPMSSTTSRTGWRRSSTSASSPVRSHRTRQPSCCSRYDLTRRPIASSSSTSSKTPPVAVAAILYGPKPSTWIVSAGPVAGRETTTRRPRRSWSTVPSAAPTRTDTVRRERNRLRRSVALAQRDRRRSRRRHRGDHPAVDPRVRRFPRIHPDDVCADEPRAEEILDDPAARQREPALREPEERVDRDQEDGRGRRIGGDSRSHDRRIIGEKTRKAFVNQVTVYSGPEPPSGGVSRPPLAVIAPHWTQFDGASCTVTVPSPPSVPSS